MSLNSSSTTNYFKFCTNHDISMYMFNAIAAVKVLLLLPLSTVVLYLGHQRWRQQRSSKTATHSDIFTYHVAASQLLWILGTLCLFGGWYANHHVTLTVGMYTSTLILSVEGYFHVFTCVERYLAVVHPIIYRRLKNARGVKIRNICIGCVWLLCSGLTAVLYVYSPNCVMISSLCFLVFSITIMCFCSLSVLCVLIRPGPGEAEQKKQKIDQSKQRAFYTITAISVTVWLWFVGALVSIAVNTSPLMGTSVACMVTVNVNWLNLPSSLVSPLLYLHRARKLSCSR